MASTISFGGLASGLDTNSLISQLVQLRRAPITAMQAQKTDLSKRLTVMNELKAKLLTLRTKAEELDTRAEFATKSAVISDDTYLTARADSGASISSYDIEVGQLARAQRSTSQGFAASTAVVGSGTFSITRGTETFDITLAEGATLQDLRDAINSSDAGIRASIVNVGGANPYRMVLAAETTGEAAAFTADASQLTGGTVPTFAVTAEAHDALVTIDGLEVRSATNTIEGAIEGVGITLRRETPADGAVTLSVESNHADLQAKLEGFITAYNEVAKLMNEQSANGATLQGETSLRTVQSSLTNLLTKAPQAGGTFRILADVGVKLSNDGLLSLDKTKLEDALASDFEGVTKLFIKENGVDGYAARLDTVIGNLTNYSKGVFKYSADSINERLRTLDRRIDQEEERVTSYEGMLRRKFSAMEQMISQLQSQNIAIGTNSSSS